MEQEVLKAVKVLGEYCNHMRCENCTFRHKNNMNENTCLFKQTSPWLIGSRIYVETKEVYILGVM